MVGKSEMLVEREITERVDLCDNRGRLLKDSIGWARQPIINCNLQGRWLRKKKWNYWYIANNRCLFSATVFNADYVGMAFIYFLDFDTLEYHEKTVMVPLARGCDMPPSVFESIIFMSKGVDIYLIKDGLNTGMRVKCRDFGEVDLEADILIKRPVGHETLNVVIPWSKNKFQFTSKQNCLPAEGRLKVGKNIYHFKDNDSFAALDFGRGVWPHKVGWNWATASGVSAESIVGINLGSKWTDNTGMVENGIVVDGRIYKISEDVDFVYDIKDLMKPWRIKTRITDRVDLNFTPIYKREAKSGALIIYSCMFQMIGYFSGRLKLDNGEEIFIDNIIGCAEEHKTKW